MPDLQKTYIIKNGSRT